MQEKLRENARLASIGELAAGVCHEINNPLSSVLGFSQLVLAEDLPQQVKADVQRIYEDALRASKIVQNLLYIARKRELRRQHISLTTILDRALDLKSYEFRTNNIEIIREWPSELPGTMVDEDQLLQVILNVTANAQQAMQASNGGGHLIARVATVGNRLRISISDDGPGIPPEHLHRVFEPFFSTKEAGSGTGLGLSVCYRIIQQHGGDIWAETTPGRGATIQIELPIVGPEEAEAREETPPQLCLLSAKHLLVVDDETNIRDLVIRCLAKDHCTVDGAENGQEAWRKVREGIYDCVILDLKMPGMSGQQLYRTMKEFNPELAKKTIFITGDTVSPDTRDFVSVAGNPVLSKPFALEELRYLIVQSLATNNGVH